METPICKKCLLFDKKNKRCKVVILYEGEKYNLPVEENDTCFFENEFVAINEEGDKEKFKVNVEQIKFWVEDENGNKTEGRGTAKVEYPEGFFGPEN